MSDILLCELDKSIYDKSLADLGFALAEPPELRLLDGKFTSLSQFKCTGKVWADADTGEKLYEFKTFNGLAVLLRKRT